MRLAAQVKCGFYPAHEHAVLQMAKALIVRNPSAVRIIDPCCGRGEAVKTLASALGIPKQNIYAIEMDGGRSEACRESLAGCNFVGDSDFLETKVSTGSMSIAWVNPPFDDEIGGGVRVESKFIQRATEILCPDGVLMAVMPERIAERKGISDYVTMYYDSIIIAKFPSEHRPFNEVCIIARKRKKAIGPCDEVWKARSDWYAKDVEFGGRWDYQIQVPERPYPPKVFAKAGMNIFELSEAIQDSPLQKLFDPPAGGSIPRPPLELAEGQRALALAGGFLNTTIHKEGEDPFVLKATPFKVNEVKGVEEKEKDDGSVTTTTTLLERIALKIRMIYSSGEIQTLEE